MMNWGIAQIIPEFEFWGGTKGLRESLNGNGALNVKSTKESANEYADVECDDFRRGYYKSFSLHTAGLEYSRTACVCMGFCRIVRPHFLFTFRSRLVQRSASAGSCVDLWWVVLT